MPKKDFMALPEEKRRRLINAGFKVFFSANEYKKASTEDIAREARISKGYLFYYFRNKKSLYLFLYDMAIEITRRQVLDSEFREMTDFFEIMAHSVRRKAQLSVDYPYLTDFIVRAFFSQREEVSSELQQKILEDTEISYREAFRHLDLSRFKDGVDPAYVMRILHWMGDGYLHKLQRQGRKLDVDEMVKDFDDMLAFLKSLCYREEEV